MFRRIAASLHGKRRQTRCVNQQRCEPEHGISRPYLKKLCLRKGTCKDRLHVLYPCFGVDGACLLSCLPCASSFVSLLAFWCALSVSGLEVLHGPKPQWSQVLSTRRSLIRWPSRVPMGLPMRSAKRTKFAGHCHASTRHATSDTCIFRQSNRSARS